MRPEARKIFLAAVATVLLLDLACAPAATGTATAIPTPTTVPTALAVPGATPTAAVAPAVAPTATPAPAPKAPPASAGPKYGGLLRHRILRNTDAWDPVLVTTAGEWLMFWYPRLFSLYKGKPGEPQCQLFPIQPELATGFKWVDDITLDVAIRQGVRFPQTPPLNGREVSADDVVFSFQRYFARMAYFQAMSDVTESVTKVDRYTVRFKLKAPLAEFPEQALAYYATPIMPPETLDRPGDPTGTYGFTSHKTAAYGRFRPTGFAAGVSLDMEKNPDHFIRGLPYLDAFSWKTVPEESTFIAGVRSGRLDSGMTRVAPVIEEIARGGDPPQVVCPFGGTAPLYLNQGKMGHPALKDVNVRRAISMAIDREAVNKLIYVGLGFGAYSLTPTSLGPAVSMELKDYPPEVRRWVTHDVNAAKELLQKTSYPKGFTAPILYTVGQPGMPQLAELLGGMLKDIGIQLVHQPVSLADYSNITSDYPWDRPDTKYTALFVSLGTWIFGDDVYAHLHSGMQRNRSVVNDPKLERMLEEQRLVRDVVKRQQLLREIQVYAVDHMYMVPLPSPIVSEVHQPYVKGVYLNHDAFYDGETARDLWLDR